MACPILFLIDPTPSLLVLDSMGGWYFGIKLWVAPGVILPCIDESLGDSR